jgi:hypothetical protein
MSSELMILMRLSDRVLELDGRAHLLDEHAVDAVADAELLLVRLDVDVAAPFLMALSRIALHEADDGRVLGGLLELEDVDVVVLAGEVDVASSLEALEHDPRRTRPTLYMRPRWPRRIAFSDATTGSTL